MDNGFVQKIQINMGNILIYLSFMPLNYPKKKQHYIVYMRNKKTGLAI